jgi:hypothetical protein
MLDMFTEFEFIRETALSGTETAEGMKQLIERWNDYLSSEEHEKALSISFSTDVDHLCAWFSSIVENEPGLTGAEALCFTLFTDDEQRQVLDLRLSGSDCFIVESDGVFEDIIFSDRLIPEQNPAHSKALEELTSLVSGGSCSDAADLLPLAFAALAVSEICRRSDLCSRLEAREEIHIVTIHDSGYPLILGSVRKNKAA